MLKYEEVISYIKHEIAVGNLTSKKKLPSIRTVAHAFNCSMGTIIKAYTELEKSHIIYASPKSGYYLLEKHIDSKLIESPVIDFSSGVPDVETFPYESFQHCLKKSIELYKETLFNYSDTAGLPSLIKLLARQFVQYQIFTNSENIVITSSSQQALNLLSIMPFPNGKSTILVEQPTYYGMIKALNFNQVSAIGIERNLAGINLDDLERKFKYGDIKFFYTVPRFHNPLSTSYTRQEKESIIKLAQKYNVYIVEDDIAADLDTDKKSDPMFSYDNSSKVIYLKSYSKILMPGLRVAALILPQLLVKTFLDYKKWTDMHSPVISQGALEIYLQSGMFDIHKKEIIQLYAKRMTCLEDTLSSFKNSNIKWNIPKSGYFSCLYAETNQSCNTIVSLLKKENIHLMDTSLCFLNEYKRDSYFRISISKVNEEKIKMGLPKVLTIIQDHLLK